MINTSTINAIIEQSDQNRSSFAGVISAAVDTIGEMIAINAMADPEAPAVVLNGQIVSYGELDRRANQLANYLTNLGVEAETIVGICLDRSPESVISSLAVLKAGGAFLPLDPKLPLERLRFMLNDAKPRALITNSEFAEEIAGESCAVVAIDNNREIEKCSVAAPAIESAKDQLAYVIYTSGSTGEPKGVEITIENLLNLIEWHRSEFSVSSKDRATHLAGVGFDAAVWEVWPYLTAGASLYLPMNRPDWRLKRCVTG